MRKLLLIPVFFVSILKLYRHTYLFIIYNTIFIGEDYQTRNNVAY